jgi:hypothetical protein
LNNPTHGHVRFGSKADICSAKEHVRFAPNSDRESEFPVKGHVRFTPKSRHVHCRGHVCFGPKADIGAALQSAAN